MKKLYKAISSMVENNAGTTRVVDKDLVATFEQGEITLVQWWGGKVSVAGGTFEEFDRLKAWIDFSDCSFCNDDLRFKHNTGVITVKAV